jgi:three-Cys-motif partner protein
MPSKPSQKSLFDWRDWRSGLLPPLETHSKAKLDVLRHYIEEYIGILCSSNYGKTEFPLTIVDGFAGGGVYAEGKPGSPFVLLEAVRTAEAVLNGYRTKGLTVDCHYYFVERDKAAAECLEHELRNRGYGGEIGKTIFLIRDEFVNAHVKIVEASKLRHRRGGTRVLFFLDQCGYTDVPASLLKSISEQLNWKAEFILNFAIDWLTAYVGDNQAFNKIYPGLGLEEVLPKQRLLDAKQNPQFNLQYVIESLIGPAFQAVSGSPFFSPFYIQAPKSNRGYWLVHLAPQARARSAMLDVYWKVANGCLHYGHTGLDMLTYKPESDQTGYLDGLEFGDSTKAAVKQQLIQDFAKEIRDKHSAGISYKDFIEQYCNRTMANEFLIRTTLIELAQHGEIDVTGQKGGAKRVDQIERSDILMPGSSKVLFVVPRLPRKRAP